MKETLIVNLFGGPGIGKSTTSTGVFSLLKLHGIDCEYVSEYAKDLTWEERFTHLESMQMQIFGEQYRRIKRLVGKVDVVITDGPLMNTYIYVNEECDQFKQAVIIESNKFNNINFLLNRRKLYNPNGRRQTIEGALSIDRKTCNMLYMCYRPSDIKELNGDYTAINIIVSDILKRFNKQIKYGVTKL